MNMELTESEVAMVNSCRRMHARMMLDANKPLPANYKPEREYPLVIRQEGRYRVMRMEERKHTSYGVYDGEKLICLCVYKKGAFALVDYLLERDAARKEVA
jgi:hypothetical protein